MLERSRERPDASATPRAARCPRCDLTTTHAGDACTRCLVRRENRRIGALWLALAAPLLVAGAWVLTTIPRWPPPWSHRGSAGLALLLTLGGLVLGARGLRGLALGRSPDER